MSDRAYKIALTMIQLEYQYACQKHNDVDRGEGAYSALSTLAEEVGEVAKALNDGDKDHAIKELAQVGAVCIRFIEMLESETSILFVGETGRISGHV